MKLFVLFALVGGCHTSKPDSTSQDTIRVKVNETFEIRLGTSMGTGYSWMPKDSAYQANFSLDSSYVVNNVQGKDNGPDTQVFRFKALKKSETIIHFIHVRSWKKDETPDKEKSFSVIIE
jgi:predicted secreted protein